MATNPQRRIGADDNSGSLGKKHPDAEALSEKQLMDRIVAGDDAAMMLLYDKFSRLVYSVAVDVLSDPGVAEDITQEVFLHVWRNPSCFIPERGRLPSWLAVMTRHRAIDVLRKTRKEIPMEIDGPTDLSFQSRMEVSETGNKIAAILPLMPAPQRVALELAYFSGLTHSEISIRTGEPLGTIKSRIRLALEFLRKSLANRQEVKYPVPIDPAPRAERK